ncbi:hypothetical protein GCM10010353_38180 [Streptomyces chryseus]|uniref:Uncharacterized protein n=1 Tax=Streptomyces chryseus TaxID=68186 RepID=A0ABQ3DW29_9ACTN|nr:hypothetical protein GCM10010353_38180 [Streptomyces chryseus]GHB17196.1 hypothetical protein GCM10010346_46310 [Streptomyces chryseus]
MLRPPRNSIAKRINRRWYRKSAHHDQGCEDHQDRGDVVRREEPQQGPNRNCQARQYVEQ